MIILIVLVKYDHVYTYCYIVVKLSIIMVQINPKIKNQLKILHQQVTAKQADEAPAIIVDLPLGRMKNHDINRCFCVVGSAYTTLVHKQQVIVKIIKEAQDELTYVFQNIDKYDKLELVNKIKSIVVEEDEKPTDVKEVVEKLDNITENVPVYPPDSNHPKA